MLAFHNRQAQAHARSLGKVGVGGSDAHVVASAGSAYTEVSGARDAGEFLRGLRAGDGEVGGGNGSYFRLTRDILCIAAQMVRDNPATALLIPLMPVVPLATLAVLIDEMAFARRWSRRLRSVRPGRAPRVGPQVADRWMEEFAWP